jgi:hypothetical protein
VNRNLTGHSDQGRLAALQRNVDQVRQCVVCEVVSAKFSVFVRAPGKQVLVLPPQDGHRVHVPSSNLLYGLADFVFFKVSDSSGLVSQVNVPESALALIILLVHATPRP